MSQPGRSVYIPIKGDLRLFVMEEGYVDVQYKGEVVGVMEVQDLRDAVRKMDEWLRSGTDA